MYAVVKTGGKQYRVTQGDKLKVEKLDGNEGDKIVFDQILMVADGEKLSIGTPLLKGSTVSATIKSQGRHDKIEIVKFRRRKHFQKRTGHRQYYTELVINDIKA